MYVIGVTLAHCIDLSVIGAEGGDLVIRCLDADRRFSQRVGQFLQTRGIQGLVYPSAVPGCTGRNIVAFLDVTPKPDVRLLNREQILEQLRRLGRRSTT